MNKIKRFFANFRSLFSNSSLGGYAVRLMSMFTFASIPLSYSYMSATPLLHVTLIIFPGLTLLFTAIKIGINRRAWLKQVGVAAIPSTLLIVIIPALRSLLSTWQIMTSTSLAIEKLYSTPEFWWISTLVVYVYEIFLMRRYRCFN